MAFMIYKAGRFRKKTNNFLTLIIINHAVWKKIKKNTNSRKTEKWNNQVISLVLRHYSKETLVQRDGFPLIQAVCLSQFLPNSSSVFFLIHHE